jgi:CheY-like chemotaxis protein
MIEFPPESNPRDTDAGRWLPGSCIMSQAALRTADRSFSTDPFEATLTDILPERAIGLPQSDVGATASQIKERPHVLLVDDDEDVGRFLVSRLEKCGIDAVYAANGLMAYRAACRERPTVIVSDYAMPNGDANYLLIRLRTMPSTAEIPFIVLTGRNLASSEQQYLTRAIRGHPGAAGIVRKSLDLADLLAMLKRFCGFEHDYH